MSWLEDIKSAFRDWAVQGVPASGEYEPDKPAIRAAFDQLSVAMSAIGGGLLRFETKTLLDEDSSEEDGQLAYVWGDPAPENNTVYQSSGGTWTVAAWYFDAVAGVVQPLVDEATTAADTAVAAAEGVDATINTPWINLFPNGDFVDGVPSTRSGSAVVALTHPDMLDRGIGRGIQWRAGNEYFRYASGGSLLNKYFFAAFVVNSADAANLPSAPTMLREASGGAVAGQFASSSGYIEISAETRILWAMGQVAGTEPNLLVGSAITPPVPGTRFASEVALILSDTAIDQAEMIRQMNLAAKARKEARKWALSVSPPSEASSGILSLAGPGAEAYVESSRSGHTIRNTFIPFPAKSLTAIPVQFNFGNQYLDGAPVRDNDTGDDIAPDHVEGTTVGANHGYRLGRCTATGHGKSVADEGSVWSNGGLEYVLVDVEDANTLLIATRATNDTPPTGTYTHASGASATGDISVSAVTSIQWYPPHNNYSIRCFVDGAEITEQTGEWSYSNDVQFVEVLDILARETIIEWWVANGGASAGPIPEGDPLYRLVNVYRFDCDGQLSIPQTRTFFADTEVADIMGLQVARADAPATFRMPGAEPITYDGDTLDYGMGVASDRTLASAVNIDFDAAKLQATGEYAHRMISEWPTFAFAVGLLPVGDAAYDVRRARTSNKAFQIRGNSAKQYFRVLDKGSFTAAAGESYSAIGFRNIVPREAGRPLVYTVRYSNARAILYIDWVNVAGFDQVDVPPDLIGRTITVLDSRNATLVGDGPAAGSLTANVSAGSDHGYLVLEFAA